MKKQIILIVVFALICGMVGFLLGSGGNRTYKEYIEVLEGKNELLELENQALNSYISTLNEVVEQQNELILEMLEQSGSDLGNWSDNNTVVNEKLNEAREILDRYRNLTKDAKLKNEMLDIYNDCVSEIMTATSVADIDKLIAKMESDMKQLVEE